MGTAWRELWRAPTASFTRGGAVENFVASFWAHGNWEWVLKKDGTFRVGHHTHLYRVSESRDASEWVFEWSEEE